MSLARKLPGIIAVLTAATLAMVGFLTWVVTQIAVYCYECLRGIH